MVYGISTILFFGIMAVEILQTETDISAVIKNGINWLCIITSVVVIAGNAIYANTLYLNWKLAYDGSVSYCTRLADRIEETDGYAADTKVVVISADETGNVAGAFKEDSQATEPFNGCSFFKLSVTYVETVPIFVTEELGIEMDITAERTDEEAEYYSAIENLGIFPDMDCYVWINGILYMRLG